MRFTSVIVPVFAAGALVAQTTPHAATRGGAEEQTLTRIEHEMLSALLKADASANEKYMADSVVLTTPDGNVLDKPRLVADVKSGKLKLQSSTISDLKIRVHGETAIVTYMTTDKGSYGGQDISGQFRWTDVFIKRGGNWQLIAGHGSAAAKK